MNTKKYLTIERRKQMSYIDWNSIMGEINMDFLKPLLDEVSKIYKDQWGEARESLISNDPYGSSTLEKNLADEYSGYAGQAAKEKTAILSDYYKNFANSKYESAMKDMQSKYDDLQSQYDDYKEKVADQNKEWNKWMHEHNFPEYKRKPANYTTVTVPNRDNYNNSGSSVWPPGGTIVNPSVITDYHPFDNNSPWGGSGSYYTGDSGYYSPPSGNSQPSYSDIPWWEYNTDYDEPTYSDVPWWDITMSGRQKMNQGNAQNNMGNMGYNQMLPDRSGLVQNQRSPQNNPGTSGTGKSPIKMQQAGQNRENIQRPVIYGNKRVSPPAGIRRPLRRRY